MTGQIEVIEPRSSVARGANFMPPTLSVVGPTAAAHAMAPHCVAIVPNLLPDLQQNKRMLMGIQSPDHNYVDVFQGQQTTCPNILIVSCIEQHQPLFEHWVSSIWTNATAGIVCRRGYGQNTDVEKTQSLGIPLARNHGSRLSARRRVEGLTHIQAAFGFSMQTLAQVLRLSRAGLYKWMDPSIDRKLQKDSLKRLASIQGLAEYWMTLTPAPLSLALSESPQNDPDLIELMSQTSLDEHRIRAELEKLATAPVSRARTRSERMRAAGFSARRNSLRDE